MKLRDRKRIVRELCENLKTILNKNVERFPENWDGCHIRALAGYLAESKHDSVKRAFREMKRSDRWYSLAT
jgi:hypothetical protein